MYIPEGWEIEIHRKDNGDHPVSPGSKGVKGNPSPDASTCAMGKEPFSLLSSKQMAIGAGTVGALSFISDIISP